MENRIAERLKMAVNVARSRSPSPEPRSSRLQTARPTWSTGSDTPFKDFLLSYLTDSTQQRLFAFTFADQIHRDRNALVVDFEDVYIWLGHTRRDDAVRLLETELNEGEYMFTPRHLLTSEEAVDQSDRYLISITILKKLLLSLRSQQGRDYYDLIITIEGAAYDYMKIEMERARELIDEHKARTTELAKQVEDLRLSKVIFWLYAYRLFENRYKCGFTSDIEARTKQHKTSCPSGYLSHKVVVHTKALEKVMDSVLKAHGRHITQEEYIFDGGDSQVVLVLNTIAEFENVLHVTPLEKFDDLRRSIETFMTTAPRTAVEPNAVPIPIDYASTFTSEETNPYAYFVDIAVERDGSENDFLNAKDAIKVWKALKRHRIHKRVLAHIPRECELIEQFTRHLTGSQYFANAVVHFDGGEPRLVSGLFKKCSLRFSVVGTGLTQRIAENPERQPTAIRDPIEAWLSETFVKTGNEKDRIGAREAYLLFKDKTALEISENDFNVGMKSCGVSESRFRWGMLYKGLKERESAQRFDNLM